MKKKINIQELTMTGVVAALYMVLTLLIQPLSYGAVQIRFSEVLALLPFFNKKFSWSIVIGCALANLFSPLGPIDLVFGLTSSILCVLLIQRLERIWTAAAIITAFTGVFVGVELFLVYGTPIAFNMITVAAGEAVAMVCGVVLWKLMLKNPKVKQLVQPRKGTYGD